MEKEHEDAESAPRDTAFPVASGSDEKHADPQPAAGDFHPIRIIGEPLSDTIIRERRERPW
jgi:hypothetical protein